MQNKSINEITLFRYLFNLDKRDLLANAVRYTPSFRSV